MNAASMTAPLLAYHTAPYGDGPNDLVADEADAVAGERLTRAWIEIEDLEARIKEVGMASIGPAPAHAIEPLADPFVRELRGADVASNFRTSVSSRSE